MVRGMSDAPKKAAQSVSPGAIDVEISGLLKATWVAEFRREMPKAMWRDLLLRTLAWRLQERAFGGHDRATPKLLEEYGRKMAADQRCQRLKTGRSLSAILKAFGMR